MAKTQILTHMAPRDIPLWAAYYLSPEGQTYTSWEFDVITGQPDDPGAFYPANLRKQALYVNGLKIDAVAWLFGTPTLIECKPNATCGAIGQILSYQKYFRMMTGLTAGMLIVCRRMPQQIKTLCDLDGIVYRLVEPAPDYIVAQAERDVLPKIEKKTFLPLLAALQ